MHLYLAAISSSTTRGPERTGVWTHTSRTRKRAPFNKGDFCIALSWARASAVVGAHSSSSTESASRGSDGFSWPSGARTAAKPACQLRAEKHHAPLQRAQEHELLRARVGTQGSAAAIADAAAAAVAAAAAHDAAGVGRALEHLDAIGQARDGVPHVTGQLMLQEEEPVLRRLRELHKEPSGRTDQRHASRAFAPRQRAPAWCEVIGHLRLVHIC